MMIRISQFSIKSTSKLAVTLQKLTINLWLYKVLDVKEVLNVRFAMESACLNP